MHACPHPPFLTSPSHSSRSRPRPRLLQSLIRRVDLRPFSIPTRSLTHPSAPHPHVHTSTTSNTRIRNPHKNLFPPASSPEHQKEPPLHTREGTTKAETKRNERDSQQKKKREKREKEKEREKKPTKTPSNLSTAPAILSLSGAKTAFVSSIARCCFLVSPLVRKNIHNQHK